MISWKSLTCRSRRVQCVTLPCFFPSPPSLSPLLSICSKSASICLFVSVTSTIGRQSALFSAINHSVGAITDTLFLGARRSHTLGDCTADGFPGFICPPGADIWLSSGVTSAETSRVPTRILSGHGHVCWRRPRSRSWLQPAWVSERSATSHCYSQLEAYKRNVKGWICKVTKYSLELKLKVLRATFFPLVSKCTVMKLKLMSFREAGKVTCST